MAKFIYRKQESRAARSYVEVQAEDGEELSQEQALIVLLDLIDSRLCDIQNEIGSRP